jgi:hypothetical protein
VGIEPTGYSLKENLLAISTVNGLL